MDDNEGSKPRTFTGKTVPPGRQPVGKGPGRVATRPVLHDRSSLVYPDAMKETARQILLLYKQHTGFGMEKLRVAIAGRDCKTLTKDDLKHWLGYRSILGDRKFQYVDQFIRSLDQSTLPDEIRHVLIQQQEGYLRDAMIRALRPAVYTDEQKQALHNLLSDTVYGALFCEIPGQRQVRHIEEMIIFPWLFFLQIGRVSDGFGSIDVFAGRPSKAELTRNYNRGDLFECLDEGRDGFFHILSGYLMVTSTGNHVFGWPDAAVTLVRRTIPQFEDQAFRCLDLPDIVTFSCRFLNFPERGHFGLSTNFPMPFNSNASMLPHFRPWLGRFHHPYEVAGIDKGLAAEPLKLAPHCAHKWGRISDRAQYDRAVAVQARDDFCSLYPPGDPTADQE